MKGEVMTATLEAATVGYSASEMSAEIYHANAAISASMLEDFRESRRLYEGRYITRTIPRRTATPVMQLGTNIHLRVLEPEKFFELLAPPMPTVAPDGKKWLRRKDSDHERWWADELAKREGKLALEQAEIDHIEAVAQAVLSKPWAKPLLAADGEPEFSIFWTDEETGLRLQCRVDWFRPLISVDLKTTGDASPAQFVRRCVE